MKGALSGLLRMLATTVATLLLFGVFLEVYVRVQPPTPRINIVREDALRRLVEFHGTWTWKESDRGQEAFDACLRTHGPDVPRILVVGSSIAYGTSLEDDEPFTILLMERAAARGTPVCILNAAQPASVGEQKLAFAKALLASSGAETLLWEIWSEGGHFARVADWVYLPIGGMKVDDDGVPAVPWLPLPAPIHHQALALSRGYEFLTLALASPKQRTDRPQDIEEGLVIAEEMKRTADAHGARLVPLFATPLPDEGTASVASRGDAFHVPLAAWFDERGIPWLDLGAELAGEDVKPLRLDPCCHLSAQGHERLADMLESQTPFTTAP